MEIYRERHQQKKTQESKQTKEELTYRKAHSKYPRIKFFANLIRQDCALAYYPSYTTKQIEAFCHKTVVLHKANRL